MQVSCKIAKDQFLSKKVARMFKLKPSSNGADSRYVDAGEGSRSRGGGKGVDVVYAADMAAVPKHWKPMSGLTQRTCIFHKDTWNRSITALDAQYVATILRGAFSWMDFDDFDDAMRRPQAQLRAAKKSRLSDTRSEKSNFYDLTMSSDEEVDDDADELANEVALGGLGEIFRRLAVYKQSRVVQVDQMQNAESWSMQRSFIQVHKITDRPVTVYHGTTAKNIDNITREGLRAMYARRSAYGVGVYVSSDFNTAVAFAEKDRDSIQHVLVLRCVLGSVKQIGYDSSEHGFYGSKEGDPSMQYHTKEVKHHKYFVVFSDAQLVCEAIIQVQPLGLGVAQSYADFTSLLTPLRFERPGVSGKTTEFPTVVTYQWTKHFVDMLAAMGNSSVDAIADIVAAGASAVGGVGRLGAGGGVGGSGRMGVGGNGRPVDGGGDGDIGSKIVAAVSGVGGSIGGVGSVGGIGGIGGGLGGVGGGSGNASKLPNRFTATLAQAKKQLLSLKKQSLRDAKTAQEREKAKQDKLLARQAALPVANINLPGHCFILKGSTVVLKNLDKSKKVMEGAEGVVRLIVKECAEYGDAHMFMVELHDHKLHPVITLANQRKERKYKQSGYSRYGEHMKEHYFIAKYNQVQLKSDGPGTPPGPPNNDVSDDSD